MPSRLLLVLAVAAIFAVACGGASSIATRAPSVMPAALAAAVTRTLNATSIKATEATATARGGAQPAATTFIYQSPDRVETDLANGATVIRIGTATYAQSRARSLVPTPHRLSCPATPRPRLKPSAWSSARNSTTSRIAAPDDGKGRAQTAAFLSRAVRR